MGFVSTVTDTIAAAPAFGKNMFSYVNNLVSTPVAAGVTKTSSIAGPILTGVLALTLISSAFVASNYAWHAKKADVMKNQYAAYAVNVIGLAAIAALGLATTAAVGTLAGYGIIAYGAGVLITLANLAVNVRSA
jgi:hypothetical protein